MSFKIKESYQSAELHRNVKIKIYKDLFYASQKTGLIRLTGLGVGLTAGVLRIATRISLIAEALLKAVLNIVGSPFVKECHAARGFYQLLILIPRHLIVLPFSTVAAILDVFKSTLYIAYTPTKTLHRLWCENDPVEKQRFEKTLFERVLKEANEGSEDPKCWVTLANYYKRGIGTEVNREKSHEAYERAAALGDKESIKYKQTHIIT